MTSKYVASGAFGVELKCPAVTKESIRLYFGWISELHKKRIKYIDFFYSPNVQSLSGNPLLPGGNAYLTLASHGVFQFLQEAPLSTFFDIDYTYGRRILFDREIDTVNSFVTIKNPDFATERSMFFVFWYDEPTVCNQFAEYNYGSSRNIEGVELVAAPGQKRTYFPDNRIIVDKPITNVFSFRDLSYGNAKPPSGRNIIDLATFNSAYLTLSKGNWLFIKNVPLSLLSIYGKFYILDLQCVTFDTTGSYVEFSPSANIIEPSSILFNVEMQAP